MVTLRVIGGIYIISAFWCLLNLDASASSLGFIFLQDSARLEYISVYGGLQLGLGLAMILISLKPNLSLGGIYFSFIFSSVLALVRLIGIAVLESGDLMLVLLILESLIALALWRVWCKEKHAI